MKLLTAICTKSIIRYLVVGPARSGTTYTHLCLRGHPNVSAFNDEIQPRPFFDEGLGVFCRGNELPEEKAKGFLRAFDALARIHETPETMVCGLKTAVVNSGEALVITQALRKYLKEVRVIFISRKDIVAQYGSLMRANLTGQYHSWQQPTKEIIKRIDFDERAFAAHTLEYFKIVELFGQLEASHKFLPLVYENDIKNNAAHTHKRLFEFLELPQVSIDWIVGNKVAPEAKDYVTEYEHKVKLVEKLQRNQIDNGVMKKLKRWIRS